MATREEADRTMAAHVDRIMENPNVTLVSVIDDGQDGSVIEIGLVAAEIEIDPGLAEAQSVRSFLPHTAPDELPIPDTEGNLAGGAKTVPVRKRIVGKIRIQIFNQRIRPALGGISCGPATATWSGTLGARIDRGGIACILSNWHVLYGGVGRDADPVLQQAVGDGGAYPADTIGYNVTGVLDQYLDAAIAEIRLPPDDFVTTGTLSYGPITGISVATPGMAVQKCGRTTEATAGTVRSINATVRVGGYPQGELIFYDQIQITAMSQPGDSGSIVLDENNVAVGLLFAGGDSDTIANKITRVAGALGLTF